MSIIIDNNKDLDFVKCKKYNILLHSAIENHNLQFFELVLFKYNFNVNVYGNGGLTVMRNVIKNRNVDMFKILLKHKPLNYYVELESSTEESLLHCCCRFRSYEIFKLLLSNGLDINSVFSGSSILMYAVWYGWDTNFIEYLLQNRCNTRHKNFEGKTVLDMTKNKDIRHLIKKYSK
jgi:ankyrin repeat protein